jgi:hypothetical protein
MTANFNDVAVSAVFDRILSWAMNCGRFATVNGHEPKSAPVGEIDFALWVQDIQNLGKVSGESASSGVLTLQGRVYTSFTSQPFDSIDPRVLSASNDLMGALCADFDFDGIDSVRNLDIFGISGVRLRAQAGYVEIDKKMFRVMTITIPVIINDMFTLGS